MALLHLFLLAAVPALANAQVRGRNLAICDTYKACTLRNIITGREIPLTDGITPYAIKDPTDKFSIRCDVNGKNEMNLLKFFWDGKMNEEFGEPRWMNGDSQNGLFVVPVDYLQTCGPKEVKVQFHVWAFMCFEKTFKLEACGVETSVAPTLAPLPKVTKVPTKAPVVTKVPTKAPVKVTLAPVKLTTAPTKAPVKATTAPVKLTKAPTKAPTVAPGSIKITEIMYYSVVSGIDSAFEWIELYNAGFSTVDLQNWVINVGSGSHTIASSLKIAPGAYLVVGRSGVAATNGGVTINYVYGTSIELGNTGDSITLIDAGGAQHDRVTYGSANGFPGVVGASIALKANNLDNSIGTNWFISLTVWVGSTNGGKGTPGAVNGFIAPAPTKAPVKAPTVAPGSVIINEIMYDSVISGTDLSFEWIELYNAGSSTVDLQNWVISVGSGSHTIASSLPIAPGAYVLVGRNGVAATNGGVTVSYVYGTTIELGNTGDSIILTDASGAQHDRVTYSSTNGFPGAMGASIALKATNLDNSVGANWYVSQKAWIGSTNGDKGTPGAVNSFTVISPNLPTKAPIKAPTAAPGSVIINEIMYDSGVSGGDLAFEWIEFYNAGSSTVDLQKWVISVGSGSHTIASSLLIAPGAYVVVGRNGVAATNGGVTINYVYGATIELGNTGDSIVLTDASGAQHDRVTNGSANGFPDAVGASIALMATNLDNSVGANWYISQTVWVGSSNGGKGTPGEANDFTAPTPALPTMAPVESPTVATASIIITEIMYDSVATGTDDYLYEWIELYNAGSSTVDLQNWVIAVGSRTHTIESSLPIAPGEYVVVGYNGDAATNGGVAINYVYGTSIELGNSEDIVLLDLSGAVHDSVTYGFANGFPDPTGASIALKATNLDNSVGANWFISQTIWVGSTIGDKGTPGVTNNFAAPTKAPVAKRTRAPKAAAPTKAPRTVAPQARSATFAPQTSAPVSSTLAPVNQPVAVPVSVPVGPRKALCKKGFKKDSSGACVKNTCRFDFQCPNGWVRIPNRECYNDMNDCTAGCKRDWILRNGICVKLRLKTRLRLRLIKRPSPPVTGLMPTCAPKAKTTAPMSAPK